MDLNRDFFSYNKLLKHYPNFMMKKYQPVTYLGIVLLIPMRFTVLHEDFGTILV